MPRRRDDPTLHIALALRKVQNADLKKLTSKNTMEKDAAIDAVAEVVSSALRRQFELTFRDFQDDGRGSMAGMTRRDLGWKEENEGNDAKAEK